MHPYQVKQAREFAGLYLTASDTNPGLKRFLNDVCYRRAPDVWIRWMHMGIDTHTLDTRRIMQFVYNLPKYKFWARHRVVKFIQANLMVPWLQQNYQCPIIYLIRNPYAVISSQVKMGWSNKTDVLLQDKLIRDYLEPHVDYIKSTDELIKRIAILWCVHNKVIIEQMKSGQANIIACTYESLVSGPEDNLERIMRAANYPEKDISYTIAKMQKSLRPRKESIDKWRSGLDDAQKSKITEVLQEFDMQDYDALQREQVFS